MVCVGASFSETVRLRARSQVHLFYDTITSFYRRPSWAPDGSFLVLPSGQYYKDDGTTPLPTVRRRVPRPSPSPSTSPLTSHALPLAAPRCPALPLAAPRCHALPRAATRCHAHAEPGHAVPLVADVRLLSLQLGHVELARPVCAPALARQAGHRRAMLPCPL